MAAGNYSSLTEAAEAWFENVWNKQDVSMIPKMMAEDCHLHGLDLPGGGREGFCAFHQLFTTTFQDLKIEILEIGEQGDRVFGHCKLSGIHRATGKDVASDFSFSARWKDGYVVETRNVVNFAEILAQVDELPSDAMPRLFAPTAHS
tara:strand:- start:12393 stop:12833 length:441 start_codon:yes stop_codon:yes gene_type:complete